MASKGNQNARANRGKSYNIVGDTDVTVVDYDVERKFLRELEAEGPLSAATSKADGFDVDSLDSVAPWGTSEDEEREPTTEELEAIAIEIGL